MSVGQWIDGSSGVESGRDISAVIAPAIASGEFDSTSARTRLDDVRSRRARGLAEELRDHLVGHGRRRPSSRTASASFAAFDALRRIGLRPRVGEDQPLNVARRMAQHRERHVAAHAKGRR